MFEKFVFIWPKLGIPSHLYNPRLSVSSGYGRLGCRAFVFFKELLLNGTRAHTQKINLNCTPRFQLLLLKLNLS